MSKKDGLNLVNDINLTFDYNSGDNFFIINSKNIVFNMPAGTNENDMFILNIKNIILNNKFTKKIKKLDNYTKLKLKMFKNKDLDPKNFKPFKEDRLSLRYLDNINYLFGSIYTYTCELRNKFIPYEKIINIIKNMVFNKEGSYSNNRRAVIRILNDIEEYSLCDSDNLKHDVSCLAYIQYFKNKPKIVFRASDLKNELFTDIVTLSEFFLKPIYKDKKIDIVLIATTGQNLTVNNTKSLIYKINDLFFD